MSLTLRVIFTSIAILIILIDFNIIKINLTVEHLESVILALSIPLLAYIGLKKLPRRSTPAVQQYCLIYKLKVSKPEASEKLNSLILERSRRSKASYTVLLSYKSGDTGALLLICGGRTEVFLESEIFESILASTLSHVRAERTSTSTPEVYRLVDRLSSMADSGSRLRPPTLQTSRTTSPSGIVRLGSRIDTPIPLPVYLNHEDIEGHIGVFGSTGSGKSTTLRKISIDLGRNGFKVIMLDWTGEHASRFSRLGWAILEPRSIGLPVDALLESPLSRQMLVDILSGALGLSEPQSFLLARVLEESKPGNLIGLISSIASWPEQSNWDREVKRALYRKIELLKYFNNKYSTPRGDSYVIDISRIPSVRLRKAYALIFITSIYYKAKSKKGNQRTIIAVDEAHNLFLGESSIMEEILSESRKYNLHVIYATQSPSIIQTRIFLNTNTKIVHALRSQRDKQVIQQAMSLEDKKLALLDKLARGEALVQSPTIPEPILVKIDAGL
ncbi:MAG: ATP-binding protein [Desulfurococcales archaeon]|nr:ATP-binding protein [Desulfurococcales archaeon]